jgi:hypothetical protein
MTLIVGFAKELLPCEPVIDIECKIDFRGGPKRPPLLLVSAPASRIINGS